MHPSEDVMAAFSRQCGELLKSLSIGRCAQRYSMLEKVASEDDSAQHVSRLHHRSQRLKQSIHLSIIPPPTSLTLSCDS